MAIPLKLVPIAPSAASLPSQPQSQPAPAGKTKTATAVPSFDTASSAINNILDIIYDIFEQHMVNPELVNAHNAILNKMRLVSDLFDALSPPSMAPTVPIPLTCPLTKDYTSCTVQMDPIPAIMATLPKNSGQQSFAQAVKASAPWPSDKPPVAPASAPTLPTAPDSMPHTYMPEPFKGQRATKSNELHIQLCSCTDFNSSVL